MKKIFTLCILFYSLCSFAQFKINVKNTNINNDYLYLLKSKEDIRNDSIINEKIIDLVEAHTLDSIITKKYQHHRLFLIGWAIHKLGYHWISVDYRRHKVVGTMKREFSMSGKEHYTEYDVNLDLIPHLQKYIDLDWNAYQYTKKLHRRISKDELQKPLFIPPTNETIHQYRIHCENTPDRASRLALNTLFYPTIRPTNNYNHPNIGERLPTMGVYGPLCLDCNHHCGVEIHPYEWLWWMNLNPETQNKTNETQWLFEFTKDGSNRFTEWSTSPRVGSISFPFAFPADKDSFIIDIHPLVFKEFDEDAFRKMTWIPNHAKSMNFTYQDYKIENTTKKIIVTNDKFIPQDAWKYWIDDLTYDATNKVYTGNIHFAGAVKDLFTCSLIMRY
jgi:hypothetical protein